MSTDNNFSAVLEAFENENAYSLFVPSLKREVKFKPLNIGHQKKLIKATIDNPVFQTRFIIAIYDILVENCCEDFKKLNLNIIDFNSILLQYRKNVHGDEITITNEGKEYKGTVSESIEKINALEPIIEQDIVEGNICIVIKTPSLYDQYRIEKELRDGKLNDEQIINGATNVSSSIGDAFVGEVSKYIKDLVLLKEERVSAGYSGLAFTNKHKLIEQLPSTLIKKALPIISAFTAKLNEALTITGSTVENESKQVAITVDAGLFPVE